MGDTRGSSSLFRRAEQLRRWQESETNKTEIKTKNRKVTFSDGCIFLAAGAAGDRDELLRLLHKGADINTVNQDGITALHAACIDNNMEIVEFLVDNGADINRCDMEGWTPLHATASCGSCTMAKFLIDMGADLALVNNDGELPIDVVDDDDMARLLQFEMDVRNIDCDASRSREERQMLNDVQMWIKSSLFADVPHPKTGASALHVASAKGYIKVLRLLLDAGADINLSDVDGWTPLHAAAHWGQTEAVELLCDNLANMEAVNYVGQTPIDLSDDSMKPLMEELRRRQEKLKLRNKSTNRPVKRRKSPQGERPVKKEKDTQSDDKIQSTPPQTRTDTNVDDKEIQSWRRASSLRNKVHHEDNKNQKEEVNRTTSTPSRLNNKENEEVISRRGSSLGKDDRNCESAAHRVSEPIISMNPSTTTNRAITRSFVPPSRDDESETQRKAHAKMVRSTRRSTQGVSLEDIKSAEQLMKNKPPPPPTTIPVITQDNSTFSLEDTRLKEIKKSEEVQNDSETPTVTLQIRKKSNTEERKEEEQDGERKSQTREGTQAAIQRKRKPKRRSTGVVHVDMDEIDPEKRALKEAEKNQLEVEDDNDENDDLSTSEKDVTKGSTNSINSTSRPTSRASSVATENGDIDYKKLYLEQLAKNEQIQDRLRSCEKELKQSRDTIDNNTKTNNIRQAQSDSEKREKRALERKLSEMEEELRQLQKLKAENEKLKAENRALTRVVSKLTNSAAAGMTSLASLGK